MPAPRPACPLAKNRLPGIDQKIGALAWLCQLQKKAPSHCWEGSGLWRRRDWNECPAHESFPGPIERDIRPLRLGPTRAGAA
jgi:hypothetical protein